MQHPKDSDDDESEHEKVAGGVKDDDRLHLTPGLRLTISSCCSRVKVLGAIVMSRVSEWRTSILGPPRNFGG